MEKSKNIDTDLMKQSLESIKIPQIDFSVSQIDFSKTLDLSIRTKLLATDLYSDRFKKMASSLTRVCDAVAYAGKIDNSFVEKAMRGFEVGTSLFENKAVYGFSDSFTQFSDTCRMLCNSIGKIANFRQTLEGAKLAFDSPSVNWLKTFDISYLFTEFRDFKIDPKKISRFNDAYLQAMYECNWFPYVGWTASVQLTAEISDILATSRGNSKRRRKRVDEAILRYYTKREIRNIKRIWKNSDLEFHIKKILGQAIEAHIRGEFALSTICLATLWESLIEYKVGITGRRIQGLVKEDFKQLVGENDFKLIISDFYNNLIVRQCDTPEDVIEGVPNRNGISHGKYKKYPNKKSSINAILLTDFIISLKPKQCEQAK